MRNGIFISYRRRDTEGEASRLSEDLRDGLEGVQIFRDVENIAPGEDFIVALERALDECAVMLVMIGPTWLETRDADGKRRLEDAADWTRLEIATGLKRDVRVIPVTCRGARMPETKDLPEDLAALARRQAIEIDNNRWRYDVDHLVDRLVQIPGMRKRARTEAAPPSAPKPAGSRKGLIIGGAVAGVIALWAIGSQMQENVDTGSTRAVPDTLQRGTGSGTAAQKMTSPPPAANMVTEPAPPPAAPVVTTARSSIRDVSGLWRTTTGEIYEFQQDGTRIVMAAAMNGVVVGGGQGLVNGANLQFAMTINANGIPININCNMNGAPDNRSYTGVCMGPRGQYPAQFFR
ncbi:MAG TPA: toll/interleukin-1 receptor domain-containing protein [Burkholderiaceae bacterium]|nr:toll/interleukin-1 receptor domain-containing protein [Burkholderiaceae bacterium]